MALLDQTSFFKKYHIDQYSFYDSRLSWSKIEAIYEDYLIFSQKLKPIADNIAEILRKHPDIHTVKTRIKRPEHLIEKIIRKSIENNDNPHFKITIESYKKLITDLVGIRILHLYKDQAYHIDKFIQQTWPLTETATIYYREGDNLTLNGVEDSTRYHFEQHPVGYRSWHYVLKVTDDDTEYKAEVQVRTIFEEGWSEVDHQLRYPYDLDNPLLEDQLLVLNRLAGSADELANTIRETQISLDVLRKQNEAYKEKIEALSEDLEKALEEKTFNEQVVKNLKEQIDSLKASIHFPNKAMIGKDNPLYVRKIQSSLTEDE
ncbi:MAG TPA: hypothetical protein VFF20_11175 [Pseudogracilibacillus sp.]|nr:hypothetical protein [Pseudogracilibacillus sp.]